jgi:MFS family permease
MKTRLNTIDLLVLNAYWVGLSFMWNGLHVILLPAILLKIAPENLKNTYLGLLTFGGLIIAMVVQPISGAMSDRWRSAWGRRRPLAVMGTTFDLVFLAWLANAGGLGWLIVGYLGLQLSSNIAHGPLQGLLPDQTPREQLGRASGFKNFMDMWGLILASLILGRVFNPQADHAWAPIALIMGTLIVSAMITFLGVREKPSNLTNLADDEIGRGTLLQAVTRPLQEIRRIDWKANRPFGWLIASRFFYLTAIYGIQVFAQYYLRDVLAAENPVKLTGDLLATITIALVLFALLGGWLGDRLGHRKIAYVASGIGAFGCLLLLWARTPAAVLAFGSVLGVGIGLFLTANWALLNEHAPAAEAGMFMGLTNLATAGSGALGRLEGPLIDALNNLNPGAWWGYSGLFISGAVCIIVSAILLLKVERPTG